MKETCQSKGVNGMSRATNKFEQYTLRDGTIKTIRKVRDRSLSEEMKALGITENDILSMQTIDEKTLNEQAKNKSKKEG